MDARDAGGVDVEDAVERPRVGRGVGVGRLVAQLLILQHQPDHVHAEAVHAAVEPEAHVVEHGRQHVGVAVVQFRLAAVELVHVELAGGGVVGPGVAAEVGLPVVGQPRLRRAVAGGGVGPDVGVALGVVAAAAALHEPGVLVRGVVGHQVEDDAQAAAVGLGQQAVEVGQRAEQGVDVAVVGHIVAEVVHRRREDGRNPDGVYVQGVQIVEPPADAVEVADAIAVRILEGARVDLVDDAGLPPVHGSLQLSVSSVQYSVGQWVSGSVVGRALHS